MAPNNHLKPTITKNRYILYDEPAIRTNNVMLVFNLWLLTKWVNIWPQHRAEHNFENYAYPVEEFTDLHPKSKGRRDEQIETCLAKTITESLVPPWDQTNRRKLTGEIGETIRICPIARLSRFFVALCPVVSFGSMAFADADGVFGIMCTFSCWF